MSALNELLLSPAVVTAAADGDTAAFTRIVAQHHDDMVRVAYLISGDVELAHEAVQSAWSTAWLKLKDLRDPDRLRPWLVSVAANEARQLLRRRRRHSVREIDLDSMTGLEASGSADRDDSIDLLDALARISPDDRAILAMRYGLGLTSDEIGKAIGMSAPGVRSRLTRSVARLRKDLGHE